jgi:hypothetical protein
VLQFITNCYQPEKHFDRCSAIGETWPAKNRLPAKNVMNFKKGAAMAKKILYGIMLTIAVSSLATISACRYFSSAGTREAMMGKFTIDMKLSDG